MAASNRSPTGTLPPVSIDRHALVADHEADIGDVAQILFAHQGDFAGMDEHARRDFLDWQRGESLAAERALRREGESGDEGADQPAHVQIRQFCGRAHSSSAAFEASGSSPDVMAGLVPAIHALDGALLRVASLGMRGGWRLYHDEPANGTLYTGVTA